MKSQTNSAIRSWVLAARPKTLTAAVVPILVGSALAWRMRVLPTDLLTNSETVFDKNLVIVICSLLASLFIQIATNLVNDAIDFKKGADTEKRIGPQRVTQSGLFSGKQVMRMAFVFFALAILCGIPLLQIGGWPIFWIGVASLLMGYGYTGGPFPLAYLGLGDLFVILFFGLIAVGGVFFLQTHTLPLAALIAGLQVGLHCTVLIAINNLRDVHGDKLVGKKTLAVRFGIQNSKREIILLCWLPFVLNIYWLLQGYYVAALLPLLAFPLAIKISRFIVQHEPSPQYNQILGVGAGLHLVFGVLLSIGLWL